MPGTAPAPELYFNMMMLRMPTKVLRNWKRFVFITKQFMKHYLEGKPDCKCKINKNATENVQI